MSLKAVSYLHFLISVSLFLFAYLLLSLIHACVQIHPQIPTPPTREPCQHEGRRKTASILTDSQLSAVNDVRIYKYVNVTELEAVI